MGLKKIIGLSIFLGDIFLIIWLISFIGVKNTAWFMLSYIIFTLISATILLLLFRDLANETIWEEAYTKRTITKKKGYWRFILMLMIIILSMLSIHFGNPAWVAGISASTSIVLIWLLLCKDILYVITGYIATMEDMIYQTKLMRRFFK